MKHRSDDRLLKVLELTEFLGVAHSTLYKWVEEGTFPKPYKMGKKSVRWRLSEVEQWLEENRQ